jgi:hypothetical protein
MNLSEYMPSTGDVPLGRKGSFKVKGIDFDDLQVLIADFLPDLERLWEMVSQVKDDRSLESALILKVATEVPALLGEIIAIAARPFDPTATSMHARSLPFPVQVKAMETISRLTFEEFGGPKEFVGLVMTMIRSMSVVVPNMMPTSPTKAPLNGSIVE